MNQCSQRTTIKAYNVVKEALDIAKRVAYYAAATSASAKEASTFAEKASEAAAASKADNIWTCLANMLV